MPIIKPRARKIDTVRHDARLLEPNRDAVLLYAEFIDERPDYVLNRLIETTIAKDREYLDWRVTHPHITAAMILARDRRRRPSKPRPASHATAATANTAALSNRS
ncbi:MAG TPA: hypothetical protein VIX35_09385 [Vicinamibacterales bacterium]